jgi:hypothetical protein
MSGCITRTEAKKLGLKTYFTGHPCSRGHVSPRYVSCWACVECLKEDREAKDVLPQASPEYKKLYMRKYRKTEKHKLYAKEYNKKLVVARRAHRKVYKTIKQGLLLSLKSWIIACSDCNVERATEYDHRDYSKPLLVEPVCHKCNLTRGSV